MLTDWKADLYRERPDPQTDATTPIETRLLRQLQKAGVRRIAQAARFSSGSTRSASAASFPAISGNESGLRSGGRRDLEADDPREDRPTRY